MRGALVGLLAGMAMLGGCVQDSRMRLPLAPAAEMDEVALAGIGFQEAGSFTVAGAQGEYSRGGQRVDVREVTQAEGAAGFSLRGGPVDGEIGAFCHFSQKDVALSPSLTATVEPLFLLCNFDRDGVPAGDLELGAAGISGSERRGSLSYGGRLVEVRSVHKMQGSPIPTGMPLGYVFLDQGREVGGVDLNGGIKRVYLPRNPELREATLAASIALSVFQEPEDVGLVD